MGRTRYSRARGGQSLSVVVLRTMEVLREKREREREKMYVQCVYENCMRVYEKPTF